MRQMLINFIDTYPENLLWVKGKKASEIDPFLMERLKDYKERQQFILSEAQVFRLDADAEWMLTRLVEEMKKDGLEDIYHKVKLPFPVVLLEREDPLDRYSLVGLLT